VRPSRADTDCWHSCTAYIDGGSRGNPGIAGYGVHVVDEHGQTLASLSEPLGIKTNNVAEYSALIAALKFALSKHCLKLKVFADSELLVRQISGVYRVKNPDLKVLFEQARSLIAGLKSFSIHHVPREENREADRLANLAMDGSRKNQSSTQSVSFPLQLSAIFQNGCFRPLGSVDLPENSRVYLNIIRSE
jgi:ribonuclease HI